MSLYVYVYVCTLYISNVSICVCICICIYIYMYISNVSICVCICICIYICILVMSLYVYGVFICRYDHFSGINRKVQFKLIHKDINNMPLESKSHPIIIIIIIIIQLLGPALLLIAKWGGEVTPAGERVAEELGKAFRCMYPGGEGEYSLLPGSGFLRLHSTYRHDLKVLGIPHFYNFF